MPFMVKLFEQNWMMWICGVCGDLLTITGIVFAILNKSAAGFTPIVWILLAMVFYMYFVISFLARILAKQAR